MATVINRTLTLQQQRAAAYKKATSGMPQSQQAALSNWLKRSAANKVGGAAGAIPAPHLTGAQLAGYQGQEDTVNDQYRKTLADYEFSRGNENQTYSTNSGNLTQQYAQMREALPGQAAGRGLLHSGVYGGQIQDVGNQRIQALSQLLMQHQQQLGGLDLNRSQAEKTRLQQLATIAAQRAAAQQSLALQIGKK